VAGCCERGDEPSGSGTTELEYFIIYLSHQEPTSLSTSLSG
jgi:hypothetical protein